MNDKNKTLLLWAIIALILFSVFNNFSPHQNNQSQTVPYSTFVQQVTQGTIRSVSIDDTTINATSQSGQAYTTFMPMHDELLLNELIKNNVEIQATPPKRTSLFTQILISWFPMILLIVFWLFILRQMQGGGGSGRGGPFGRSRARMLSGDQVTTKFTDVAGVEEAKEDIRELVDFLKEPERFQKLGGKMPKGTLLVGPPGTGKTLLAKAVAGEAGVPFFSISGSDFVEMFVGVGASRVRDMFEQAKKQAPCIIFIDEIDAVGRRRGAGLGGGHDEREQTLNQLLVEMDGFEGKEGVIVVAATNRPDVLDPALLRPGRFDRQVVVPLPDVSGREHIISVHMQKIIANKDVDAAILARGTPGFSGADLANLVNEAALVAARAKKTKVSMDEFEQAKDKILMGAPRTSMAMTDEEKKLTAYHESGHAIVGRLMPGQDPVYKVSIIPRGRALGVTVTLPERDRYNINREMIEGQIAMLYGGRIAEALIYGDQKVTTGASNDIERASDLARNYVTRWGLHPKLGAINYAQKEEEVFLGHSIGQTQTTSEHTAKAIDTAVHELLERNYKRAEKVLKENMDIMHAMTEALMVHETINSKQIDALMERKALPKVEKAKPPKPTPPTDEAPKKPKKRLVIRRKKTESNDSGEA